MKLRYAILWLLPLALVGIAGSWLLSAYGPPLATFLVGTLSTLGFVYLLWQHHVRDQELVAHVEAQNHELVLAMREMEKANKDLEKQANIDPLTGLFNRNAFSRKLKIALAKARREDTVLAVLFLDLARFKHINDTLGYEVGDLLIQQIAEQLHYACTDNDTVARLGGDKFVVLAEDVINHEGAARTVERIFQLFEHVPLKAGPKKIYLKIHTGIALSDGDDDSEELLRRAESMIGEIKIRGGNAYAFADEAQNRSSTDRLDLEHKLRQAIADETQIQVYFQPKRDMRSGQFGQPETLVRWIHPQEGMISPGQFIPLAEETGLIVPMGELILRKACVAAVHWANPLKIAVNFSPRQFMEADLVERVSAILAETGLPASRLVVEITESMVMPESYDKLKELAAMGMEISVDDFGTGYSNLKSLQTAPISELKIDRSFVVDMCKDRRAAALVSGIMCLAHRLNLRVVAEGVEEVEQVALLKRMKCDYIQGFIYCKPLPEEQFSRLKFVRQAKAAS